MADISIKYIEYKLWLGFIPYCHQSGWYTDQCGIPKQQLNAWWFIPTYGGYLWHTDPWPLDGGCPEPTCYSVTVLGYNDDTSSSVYSNVWMDGDWVGYTGQTYPLPADTYVIQVESYCSYGSFHYFDVGGNPVYDNPATITVSSDLTVTAHYTYNGPWYWLTVYAHDQAPDYVPTSVSIDGGTWTGMAGDSFYVPAGNHYVVVDGTVWGEYGEEWWFYYFDGFGLAENPVCVNVGSDTGLTAIYWRVAK